MFVHEFCNMRKVNIKNETKKKMLKFVAIKMKRKNKQNENKENNSPKIAI